MGGWRQTELSPAQFFDLKREGPTATRPVASVSIRGEPVGARLHLE